MPIIESQEGRSSTTRGGYVKAAPLAIQDFATALARYFSFLTNTSLFAIKSNIYLAALKSAYAELVKLDTRPRALRNISYEFICGRRGLDIRPVIPGKMFARANIFAFRGGRKTKDVKRRGVK